MRIAIKPAPALPPVVRHPTPGVFARAFAAWKTGWIAYAAALARAEGLVPALPWAAETGRRPADRAVRGAVPC